MCRFNRQFNIKGKKSVALIILIVFLLSNIIGINSFAMEEKYLENPVIRFAMGESELPEYDLIKASDFFPALNYAVNDDKKTVDNIINNIEIPTFKNTIEPLEGLNKVGYIENILYSLYSTDSNELIDRIVSETSGISSKHFSEIFFNKELFEKVNYVYENEDRSKLSPAQNLVLENTYYSFINSGIDLPLEKQERIKEINNRLNYLAYNYSSNLLSSQKESFILVTDINKLSGLSPEFIEELAIEAENRELSGWVIPTSYSYYLQVMENAENRDLRKELYMKNRSVAGPETDFDNSELVKEFVNLRLELANIYDHSSYSEWILENRMIGSKENAFSFLEEYNDKVFEPAKEEIELLKNYASSKGFSEEFQIYDYYYYFNKYKEETYSFDQEVLREYFEYENVKKGIFNLYNRLYGISFIKRTDYPVYYPEVELYEVKDSLDSTVGFLYLDIFDRSSKSSGAWCASIRFQKSGENEKILPIASISADAGKNLSKGKILLTHFDLITFLHESGHAMHLLLSDVEYQSLSGFNVSWDFVELPSSIMENWAYEKEFFETFAYHYETGELIPDELVVKIQDQRKILNAFDNLGYKRSAGLDLAWHSIEKPYTGEVKDFERNYLINSDILPVVGDSVTSTKFSHIFDGGYSAGYYSYLWAWVLDADAFTEFKENGIMSRESGERFRNLILAKGASEKALKLFKDFTGEEPSMDALAERNGWN